MGPSTTGRRRKRRNTRSKEYKRQLVDIPLDVLIEIFLFLEPLDLLHLARTTKGLRAFLLSRSKSSALWRNAISSIKNFPPCPDHMSAPAYTHLAFVPVCHGCSCPCETIEWELRMRCCPDCFPKMTIPLSSIVRRNRSNRYVYDLNFPRASSRCKLVDSCPYIFVFREFIHSENVISLLDWKATQSRKRLGGISKEEFLTQQNRHWGSIRSHACSCQDWEYMRSKEEAAQLSRVRAQRLKDIKGKLGELGWTEVVSSIYSNEHLLNLPEGRKLEPLTPSEWADIRPQLVDWARKFERDLAWDRCSGTFRSVFVRNLDKSLRAQPREIDVIMLPAVRRVLECNNDPGHLEDLEEKLRRVIRPAIRKWSSGAVEELEQFVRQQLGRSSLSQSSCFVSVIFRCSECCRKLSFDEALSHYHLYEERSKERYTREVSLLDRLIKECGTHPRNIKVLQVDVAVSRRVENLIVRIGRNPRRVTYEELCQSTIKVICGLCRSRTVNRMHFKEAFEHCLSTHNGSKETEVWTLGF